jgi:hypothetical protein
MDSTGNGDPLVEQVRKLGLTVKGITFTTTKQQLVEDLILHIEQKKVSFPKRCRIYQRALDLSRRDHLGGVVKFLRLQGITTIVRWPYFMELPLLAENDSPEDLPLISFGREASQ